MARSIVIYFCWVLNLTLIAAQNSVLVATKLGKVEGFVEESETGFKVDVFLGLKYGEIPHRFTKSVMVKPWTGVKVAKTMPPRCSQVMIFGHDEKFLSISNDTEDCLYLNLVAPHSKNSKGYPIMVFIHGGGFTTGSSLEYGVEGIKEWIVPKGIVFITFHYRLASWGFFSTGTNDAAGNWGLWDQSLLLQWVQENIAEFGGDPNKVTLFGESAGAMSTALHSVSPHSRDLFHTAIMMSGSLLSPYTVNDRTVAESFRLADLLGCKRENHAEMLKCMRSISDAEFSSVVHKMHESHDIYFMPVIDDNFLPGNLETLLKNSSPKPSIIGVTKDEMGLFISPPSKQITSIWLIEDPKKFQFDDFRTRVKNYFLERGYKNADLLTEICVYHYVDSVGFMNNGTLLTQAYTEFVNDYLFNAPGLKEAQLRMEFNADVWLYSFDYFNKEFAAGAYHWYDLWYLFKFTLFRSPKFTKEEEKIANYYTTLFTNFAKYGNPTHTDVDNIVWPKITKEKPETYLKIDTNLEVRNFWNRKGASLWNDLFEKIQHQYLIQTKRMNDEL